MAVTPSNGLSLVLSRAQALIAASSTFQTWVGAASAAAALARVHLVTGGDGVPTRPFAAVSWRPQGYTLEAVSGGSGHVYQESGAVEVLFENAVGTGNSADSDAALEHTNATGGIVEDLAGLAGSNGYLNVTQFHLLSGPMRSASSEGEAVDYVQSVWEFEWGI